jgi:HEAT repeat protein
MTITPDSVKALLDSGDYGDRLRGVNQLRQLDPAVAFALIQPAVVDPNVRVRYAAVSQLSTLGQQDLEQSCKLLRSGLYDSEIDVQAAAADAIGALHLTQAFEDLEKLYHRSSEWIVKFSLLATLGELGDPRCFDLLASALETDDELMKMAAVGSLGELGDPRAVALLIPYVTDGDWQVRQRIVQALSYYHTPEARAALETLTQDSHPAVAEQAQAALKPQG